MTPIADPTPPPFPADLPLYAVVDWPAKWEASVSGWSGSGRDVIVGEAGVNHWSDDEEQHVRVESHRRLEMGPGVELAEMRGMLASNIVFPYLHRLPELDTT